MPLTLVLDILMEVTLQTKATEVGTSFTPKSTYDIGNFNTLKSTAKNVSAKKLVKEYNHSNPSSLVDKINQ
eukprot:bmy_20544T0